MSVPYVQIETISMSRLRNGELYTFVKRTIEDIPYDEEEDDGEEDGPQVQAVIRNLGKSASKINVSSELIERANEKLQALSYLTREGRAYEETAQLETLDKLRSESAMYILNRVSAACISPVEAERTAGLQMQTKLKMYTGLNRLPVYDKSGVIDGLYADVTRPEFATSFTKLALAEPAAQMKSYNDQYEEIATQREATMTELGENAKTKELRADIIDIYTEIADRAFSTNVLEPNDDATSFLKRLNTRISDFRARVNRRNADDEEDLDFDDDEIIDDEEVDDTPVVTKRTNKRN